MANEVTHKARIQFHQHQPKELSHQVDAHEARVQEWPLHGLFGDEQSTFQRTVLQQVLQVSVRDDRKQKNSRKPGTSKPFLTSTRWNGWEIRRVTCDALLLDCVSATFETNTSFPTLCPTNTFPTATLLTNEVSYRVILSSSSRSVLTDYGLYPALVDIQIFFPLMSRMYLNFLFSQLLAYFRLEHFVLLPKNLIYLSGPTFYCFAS